MTTPAPESRGLGISGMLAIAAAVLLPRGHAMILLGGCGAAPTPARVEQVPDLNSGGLLGLGLAVVGGLVYFGSWIARGNAEQHAKNEQVVALLQEIRDELRATGAPAPRTPASNGHVRTAPTPGALVATAKGGMIHRPDCAVVAGRSDLRTVSADDTLAPCSLCTPLEVDVLAH